MKKSIKVLGLAALAMLTVVSCKSKAAEAVEDTLPIDTAIEMVVEEDTLAVVDTLVAEEAAPVKKAATKKAVKKAEPTVKATTLSKPEVKEAGELKQGEGNTVQAQSNPSGKKSAKEAFKRN